jgi:hypothetical protein
MTVARTFHDCLLDRAAWHDLLAGPDLVPDSTYHPSSYDHCRARWLADAAGRELRLFVWHRAEQPVGLLPLCLETWRLGPVRLRLARRLDDGPERALAIERPALLPALAGALDQLFRLDGCDAVALAGPSRVGRSEGLLTGVAQTLCLPPPLAHAEPAGVTTLLCASQASRQKTALALAAGAWAARLAGAWRTAEACPRDPAGALPPP